MIAHLSSESFHEKFDEYFRFDANFDYSSCDDAVLLHILDENSNIVVWLIDCISWQGGNQQPSKGGATKFFEFVKDESAQNILTKFDKKYV